MFSVECIGCVAVMVRFRVESTGVSWERRGEKNGFDLNDEYKLLKISDLA